MPFLLSLTTKFVTLASLQINTLVQVLMQWKNLDILGGAEANNKFGSNYLRLLET